jgi:pimeloyl-ACP methyl ester carboxylesterase
MVKQLQFEGAKTQYKVTGSGPAVILVHGFLEEGSMWNGPVRSLSKSFKVIVPDLPGFGKSELFSRELTMDVYAEYIYALAQKEKLKKFILLGHSMGGYITLYYAEKYGNTLSGFGLINSHCFADTDDKKANRLKGIEHIKQYGTKVFVKELYQSIFHPKFIKANKKLINGMIAKALKYSPEGVMRANAAMMNRKDKSDALVNAKVPVLLVNGKDDMSAPLPYTLKQASFAPISDVHFFSECKHMSVFERSRETNKIIRDFCERVTR